MSFHLIYLSFISCIARTSCLLFISWHVINFRSFRFSFHWIQFPSMHFTYVTDFLHRINFLCVFHCIWNTVSTSYIPFLGFFCLIQLLLLRFASFHFMLYDSNSTLNFNISYNVFIPFMHSIDFIHSTVPLLNRSIVNNLRLLFRYNWKSHPA